MQLVYPSCNCLSIPKHQSLKVLKFDPLFKCQKLSSILRSNVIQCISENQDYLLAEDCPVPKEQQPMYELKSLQEMMMFNWATLPLGKFVQRLAIVYLGFFAFVGLPISAFTFDPVNEPVQFFSSASVGCLFIVIVTVLRLYLGWAHVGNRLLSATVEYEETGWYDGQVWVKPPQVLMRDRLLGNYTVRPTLTRLRNTLVSLAGGMAATVAVLLASPPAAVQTMPNMLPMGYVGSSGRQVPAEIYEENVRVYEGTTFDDEDDIDNNDENDAMGNRMAGMMGHSITAFSVET
eukprot:TRINITY_DN28807_c0_g1_i4.p3 TRINITY_DN28807_c0_g1~~TRINITY_DN28807_c0_g1_i4.p3  ORF type:complete len:318 (-),score=11.01 TRINITY_DN28807_c0_g1_i4:250-1122(-)